LKDISYAHQGCVYLIKMKKQKKNQKKNSNIVKYYCNIKKLVYIQLIPEKAEFSAAIIQSVT